jgi:hypothetical protein
MGPRGCASSLRAAGAISLWLGAGCNLELAPLEPPRSDGGGSAPFIVSHSEGKLQTPNSTLVIVVPDQLEPGDVLVAGVGARLVSDDSITEPEGWTRVVGQGSLGGAVLSHIVSYRAVELPGPADYTWTLHDPAVAMGGIVAVRGADPNVVDVFSKRYEQDVDTIIAPSVTTKAPNDLLLAFFATNGAREMDLDDALKLVYGIRVPTPDLGGSVYLGSQTLGAPGQTGDHTCHDPAIPGENSSNIGQLVAIRP